MTPGLRWVRNCPEPPRRCTSLETALRCWIGAGDLSGALGNSPQSRRLLPCAARLPRCPASSRDAPEAPSRWPSAVLGPCSLEPVRVHALGPSKAGS